MINKLLTKEEILEKAIKALRENFDVEARTSKNIGIDNDYEIELKFSLDEKIINKRFHLEVNNASPSVIGQLALNKDSENKPLLVANYVLPASAQELRNFGISFIDTVGNAFFKEPEFYVFISSRAKESEVKSIKPNIIFQQSGLQLIFLLLSKPNSENLPYRMLAERSGISLGSVNEIMAGLTREFYLVTQNEKRLLVRKDELLKRWVQGYSEILRPKIFIGNFGSSDRLFEESRSIETKEMRLKFTKSCCGGEFAADLLTNYLKPSKFTLFTKNAFIDSVKLQLRRDPNGKVEVFRRFWKFDEDSTIAPPLLVYADLVASADARNLEAAKIIYDEHLAKLVE